MTTDWTRYDVPAIASFLNEDLAVSWRQVLAWEEAFSLLNGHSSRLRLARDTLAESWSPQRSEASSVFMANVDEMVVTMADTADAAIINRDALIGVLSALESARVSIDRLHQKWQSYAARQSASLARPEMPRISVPKDWQAHLNAQAHATMAAADQAIFDSTQKMIVPGGGLPITTPITPLSASGPEQGSRGPDGRGADEGGEWQSGEGRSGANSTHIEPTSPPPSPVGSLTPSPGDVDPIGPGSGPEAPSPTNPGSGLALGSSGIGVLGGAAAGLLATGRGSPSSGRPASSRASATAPSSTEPSPESVKAGQREGPMTPPMLAGGQHDRKADRRSPKTTKWATPSGVQGLITPSPAVLDHDLGPGVIGLTTQ